MAFNGMKRRDRQAHVNQLDTEWSYWNRMDETQLREIYVEKAKKRNPSNKEDALKAKAKGYDKETLIRKLVVGHIREMV